MSDNHLKIQTGSERIGHHTKEAANERNQHYLSTPVRVAQAAKQRAANNQSNHLNRDCGFDGLSIT